MTTCYLAPDPIQSTQFIPGGNTPANGGQLFFYVAGSSTKQTVYKDNAAATSWSNPIVLDSGGNLPSGGEVWFPTGQTFKVIFAPSNDTDPPASAYWTKDNLSGINDVASSNSDWVSGATPTYVSATSFTLVGDQTATYKVGRRIKTTNTAGTIYSTITSSVYGVLTTLTVVNDSGSLDSGLSAVFYSLLDPQYSSINSYYVDKDGGTVASAANATTNIWGVPGNAVHISGTNTIRNFSTAAYAGDKRVVIFDGALTLQSSAAFLSVPSAPLSTLQTQAGDRALVVASTAAHAVITHYQRASGKPIAESLQFIASSLAASSATVDFVFSTAANSSFPAYLLTIANLAPQTDGTSVYLRFSEDGGGTFNASSTAYGYCGINLTDVDNTVVGVSSGAVGQIAVSLGSNVGSAAGESASFAINFYDPSNTLWNKRTSFIGSTKNAAGNGASLSGQGEYASTAAVNALRILMSSGNINTGKFTLYGMRQLP